MRVVPVDEADADVVAGADRHDAADDGAWDDVPPVRRAGRHGDASQVLLVVVIAEHVDHDGVLGAAQERYQESVNIVARSEEGPLIEVSKKSEFQGHQPLYPLVSSSAMEGW